MTVEAVMIWNEPNNLSHWDFHMDEGWQIAVFQNTLITEAMSAEDTERLVVQHPFKAADSAAGGKIG